MLQFEGEYMAINQYSILVVDDNENNLDLLNRYLGNKGYNVTIASNGREALAINYIERFDLVLLDIMMPDIDGLEVLKELREKATTCNIPVVILSASNDSEHMRIANELSADDFIVKNESLKIVRERILAVLKSRRIYGKELAEKPATPGNIQSRLLVVDDDELSRDLLYRRIKKFGYDVDTAESGLDALVLINKQQYDLIFLDVMMPNINGIELLEKIKSNTKTKSISVVMISSNNDDAVIKQCVNLGATDYVVKPFHYSLLKNTIEATIQ